MEQTFKNGLFKVNEGNGLMFVGTFTTKKALLEAQKANGVYLVLEVIQINEVEQEQGEQEQG